MKIFLSLLKIKACRKKECLICKNVSAWIYTGGGVGKGGGYLRLTWIQSIKPDPWIMGLAQQGSLWNTQASTKTGNVSKVEMPLLVTVSIVAFSWEHDGYGNQGPFYKTLIYLDIPCNISRSITLLLLTSTFLQISINWFLNYIFSYSSEQRWYPL